MMEILKTIDNKMMHQTEVSDGCWVNIIMPTKEDINFLTDVLLLEYDFIMSALDPEESSRIDSEEGQTLIVVDVSTEAGDGEPSVPYTTIPISIILAHGYVVTISLVEHRFLTMMAKGNDKSVKTNMRTRFVLQILLKISKRYLNNLKDIDKMSSFTENQLHQTMQNKEIIQLLGLEKSLVYFSTSLKGNEITLKKILRGRIVKLYEDDEDLLEDVIIETKQAIEMCSIYSGTLAGTMDAFSSIISNNLNISMRTLTSITLVAAIPTIISGLYGMNIAGGLPFSDVWWFPFALSGVICLIVILILSRTGMFK